LSDITALISTKRLEQVAHGRAATRQLVALAVLLEQVQVFRRQRKKPTDDAIG